jgi:hypothetical protein
VIYLYAITEGGAVVPPGNGLQDAELRLARSAEVTGIYSEHEELEPRPRPDALWRHEHVIEEAMKSGPALPARFGTTFEDESALRAELERHGEALRAQLERLRGCVELAVRVGLTDAEASPVRDGRAYVETRLTRRRTQQEIVRETLAPLGEFAVHARTEEARSQGEVVCASYLVPSDGVQRFAEQVRAIADRHPELWLSCTGPWPPYSFVELEVAA